MTTANDIGWAVAQLKQGSRVRRAGWNGKNMWLVMIFGSQWDLPPARDHDLSEPGGIIKDGYRYRSDWIAIRAAGGALVPWLASQADLLAIDYEMVVE